MRKLSQQLLDQINSGDRLRDGLGETLHELPDVRSMLDVTNYAKLVTAIDYTDLDGWVSRSGSKMHLFDDCGKNTTRRARINLARLESSVCARCLKKAHGTPAGRNAVAWSQVRLALGNYVNGKQRLADLDTGSRFFSRERQLEEANTAVDAMANTLARIDDSYADVKERLITLRDEVTRRCGEAGAEELRDLSRLQARQHAALYCARSRSGSVEQFTRPASFRASGALPYDRGVVMSLLSKSWISRRGPELITDNIDAVMQGLAPTHPESWNGLPDNLLPREEGQSVHDWMLASWKAEFAAGANELKKAIEDEIHTALDAPSIDVEVTVTLTADADHRAQGFMADMLTPYSAVTDAHQRRWTATVPSVIAGAIHRFATSSDHVRTCTLRAARSEHTELLSTAIALMSVNGTRPCHQLGYALQAAADVLGMDVVTAA